MGGGKDVKDLITEEGWPCQRLRIAFSLILFCFFELLIGRGPKVVGLEGLDRRSQLAQRGRPNLSRHHPVVS